MHFRKQTLVVTRADNACESLSVLETSYFIVLNANHTINKLTKIMILQIASSRTYIALRKEGRLSLQNRASRKRVQDCIENVSCQHKSDRSCYVPRVVDKS